MCTSWKYDGLFLTRFPQFTHNMITQLFLRTIRSGKSTVPAVLASVADEAKEALRYGSWPSFPVSEVYSLVEFLDDPEAEDFVAFLIEREALPPEEKTRLKSVQQEVFAKSAMAAQPPTNKQLEYLRGLKCPVIPTSKMEASRLIDEALKSRRAA